MKRLFRAYHCRDLSSARYALSHWYRQGAGEVLRETELHLLEQVLPNLFGYHLVQLGCPHESDLLESSRIQRRVVVDFDLSGHYPVIPGVSRCVADPNALPFESASIDVIVLPHSLEFVDDPHQLLREVERCLIPEGRLVILGFNPFSQFGLMRLLLGWRSQAPWCGHFYNVLRVRDWLALLGFDTLEVHGYFHRPPLASRRLLTRLEFIERWAGRWLAFFGGGFLLVAVKRVSTLTPIRPRWRTSRRLLPELRQPTVRRNERNRS